MASTSSPLVSVVTPVYNGEKYLAECIESVLAQTYENWEYVIVNNCSTDRSLKIAESYREKDERIRIYNNNKFLDLIPNWNHAFRHISHESKYCKVVHADDFLFPECIDMMAGIAEKWPTVSIVSSYVLKSSKIIAGCGLPYSKTFISGKEICRYHLLGSMYLFGSPSSLLIRSTLVRDSKPFYNDSYFHADIEACYNALKGSDFGFVHQILTYTRLHENSQSFIFSDRYHTNKIERLRMFFEYGPIYFDKNEFNSLSSIKIQKYYSFLARNLLRFRETKFAEYHKSGLEKMGHPFSTKRLVKAFLLKVVHVLVGR